VTLIDYEKIVDPNGERLVYFGRFAGICGLIDSLYYLGRKLEWGGIKSPFGLLKPAYRYTSYKKITGEMNRLYEDLKRHGFDRRISPFIIGITGHGNVSRGVQEILEYLKPVEIHPRDLGRFIHKARKHRNKIYKIVFLREERFRSKDGHRFYFEEYLKNPEKFESNMEYYLPYLNMLIHASYWDICYPRLITKRMVNRLSRRKVFRLKFIGDISCDINGCIELTYKPTTQDNPVFTYNPETRKFTEGYREKGISVLAVDNLPSELPKDSSEDFGKQIRDYVYQIAAHGIKDVTNHSALPREIRRAVITQENRLTGEFGYLKQYLK
jgi:alpha-aminoadipic semialdehyde synthase